MQKERFWFGMALVAVPVFFLLLALTPGIQVTQSGPIEGHVSYQGRPLVGGTILFMPEDPYHANPAIGSIDENGHYRISSNWLRGAAGGKAGFRICVMPDDRGISGRAPQGAGSAGHPAMNVASGFPRQLEDPQKTRLKVHLDSRPAQVDVTL